MGFGRKLIIVLSIIAMALTFPISLMFALKERLQLYKVSTSFYPVWFSLAILLHSTILYKAVLRKFYDPLITLPGRSKEMVSVVKVVYEFERGVLFRMGRLESKRPLAAGILLILPCTDFFIKVDMRIETFDVPSQEVLTIDSVTVHVDAVVYYRVHEPLKAVINVLNYRSATILLAATLLRNMIGTKNLTSLLSEREHLASSLQAALEAATDNWGITVERVEIKDVRLPLQMQRAMAAEAEASREAKAKVIAAQGELDASRALKEAAEVMVQAKGALQLRYLQTLCTIAAEKNSTIVFPLPIDLLTGHMNS